VETPTSSFDLIERIRQGDADAFTPLFERYRPRLALLIHFRISRELRQKVQVDDLLQETFFRAFAEMGTFQYRGRGSFFRWMARIAEHVVIDAARFHRRDKRHAREVVPFRSPSNPFGPEPATSRTPSRILFESEKMRSLMDGLAALPEDDREVILLAKIEGLSMEEIGRRMSRSRSAAALLLHRALKRFRKTQAESGR